MGACNAAWGVGKSGQARTATRLATLALTVENTPTVHGDQRLSLTFLFILFPLFALNVLWHHFFIAVYFLKDHAYGSVWTGLDHRPPTESLLHIDERWGAVRLRISDA